MADVAVISSQMLAITGKAAGTTNLIFTDESYAIAVDRNIFVESMDGKKITVLKGINRETYGCTDQCNPVSHPERHGEMYGECRSEPLIGVAIQGRRQIPDKRASLNNAVDDGR